jgi:PAS domain S-box-containing protein
VPDPGGLRRQVESLQVQNEELLRRALDAEDVVAAFARGEIDTVTFQGSEKPMLLRAAQEEHERSEQLLRAVFDGALDAMLLTDDENRYVDANPAACELIGLPREQLLGRSITDFIVPGFDAAAAFQAFREQGSMQGQVPLRRPDGSERIVEYSSVASVARGLHLSVLRDIT